MDIRKLFGGNGGQPFVFKPIKHKKAKDNKKPEPKKAGTGNNGNGDGKPKVEIQAGDVFFHLESKKLYQVMGFEKGILEDGSPTYIVLYSGADSKLRRQNLVLFLMNFQKTFIPQHTKSQMEKMQGELSRAGKLVPTKDGLPKSESDMSVDGESLPLGSLYKPSERYDVKNMIIWPDALESIQTAIDSISKRKDLQEVWKLDQIDEDANKSIINLYGPSGTGKTMVAKCIARIVNKNLFQVNYSEIVDKYVGETGKHISAAFQTAKEQDAILFFDEADSLCSKRVDMNVNADYANSVNQNRNILMQELDKFENIIIMSTNFFNNFDEALIRRIQAHIEMKLPNAEMREKLYQLHIPNLDLAKEVNFAQLAKLSPNFSGGDIRNVCVQGMKASSRDSDITKWKLTELILEKEIQKIKDAKDSHKKSGSNTIKKEAIGFGHPILE